jgi:hypothetical protein
MRVYDRNQGHPDRNPNWWLDYWVGAERIREPGCGTSRKATERLAAKREREIENGSWKRPQMRAERFMTVAQYAERWIEVRREEGLKTADDYWSRLRFHVLPELGDRQLLQVAREDIKRVIGELARKSDLAPRTVHRVYEAIRALFASAVEQQLIPDSPCTLSVRRGELPKKRDANPAWRSQARFTRGEVLQLLTAEPEHVPVDRVVFWACSCSRACASARPLDGAGETTTSTRARLDACSWRRSTTTQSSRATVQYARCRCIRGSRGCSHNGGSPASR